jgi:phenylpropionate dioxygenase-like ring-hydroxylating dioxygenase large terminal subunit
MSLYAAWYIACQSKDLGTKEPLPVRLLDLRLAVFRDSEGRTMALEDRCLHRNAQLSKGKVCQGQVVCPYHGWAYDGEGKVQDIPATCPSKKSLGDRRLRSFLTCEQEGYIYIYLDGQQTPANKPFSIPQYGAPGYHHIRLINEFENTVTNCVENFVDIPHTVFVHPGIFRVRKNQRFTARVVRDQAGVHVDYQNERANLGIFSRFLNPSQKEIIHRDHFYTPNITSVEYDMGPKRHFFITSQSIPIAERKTLVYTDLTFNYGLWNRLAAPLVRRSAQIIIDQDKVVLAQQNENLIVYGEQFQNTSSDLIHVYIESIRHALERGEDPRLLPPKEKEIEFWI